MSKPQTNPVVLRDIDSFHGAEYNPRKMVPERLKQVEISLAKLGFVLPIYVNKNGTILSGHQRTTAAKNYGYTKVPVVELDIADDQEKGANLMFNKGTNDLDTFNSAARDAFKEYVENTSALTEELPDIPPDTVFPCMNTVRMEIPHLIKVAGDASDNLRFSGLALVAYGVHMPVLVAREPGKDDWIINGKGRIFGYAHHNYDDCEVIEINDPKLAQYAYYAMNYLAMDFNIQSNFKEELRYNAFRRKAVQNQIIGLSRTYPYFVYGKVISNTAMKYDLLEGKGNKDLMLLPTATDEARRKFKETYGHTIFDMGAGTLHDSNLMAEAGFDMVPFEPFYCPPESSRVDPDASRALVSAMLDRLDGLRDSGPDSIISSFVMNSIPHHEDRMAYLAIVSAMCRVQTPFFLGTQDKRQLSSNLAAHLRLNGADPNTTLGNDSRFFKVQKFYDIDELTKMLKVFWGEVEAKVVQHHIFAKCRYPRRPNPSLLREAIELEFDMPYQDGSRMGLADRAKEVFTRYLHLKDPL